MVVYLVERLESLDLDRDDVSVVDLNLDLHRGGKMDGGVDASADEAPGEGANDSDVGVDLGVEDGGQLQGDLGGNAEQVVHRLLALDGSLGGEDERHHGLPHPQEAGAGRLSSLDVEDFEGPSVFELARLEKHLRVAQDGLVGGLDGLVQLLLVEDI